MNIRFKTTVYETVSVKEEYEREIITLLKNKKIMSSSDLMEEYPEYLMHGELSYEIDLETIEQLSPENNNGYSTIEVVNETNILYTNGKE